MLKGRLAGWPSPSNGSQQIARSANCFEMW
jgi:hypothetical protein